MGDEDRRGRFKLWFDGPPLRGDRAALMAKTGYTKGRVSQLFDAEQPFGERAATGLAEKLGLPPDYFLRDPDEAEAAATGRRYSTQALDLAMEFDKRCDEQSLTGEQRRRLFGKVRAAIREDDVAADRQLDPNVKNVGIKTTAGGVSVRHFQTAPAPSSGAVEPPAPGASKPSKKAGAQT